VKLLRAEALSALHVPAYRRVWTAVLIASMGTWMQITGRAFLIYDITGSTSALGTIYLVSYGPQLFLAPYAGAIADRYDRRRTVVVGTWLLVATVVATGVLATTGTATLLTLSVVSLITGSIQTVTQTASLALLPTLVDKEDLSSAVSLQAVTSSATRVVGPLIAGALIPVVGVQWLFYLNALSLLPVILAWMRTTVPEFEPVVGGTLSAVVEGLRFTRRTPAVAVPLGLLTVLSAIGLVYQPLGVAYTTAVLAQGDRTLGGTYFGLLQGAIGIGSIFGILLLTGLSQRRPAAVLVGTGFVFSLALAGLGLTSRLWVALLIGLLIGGCQFANSNLTLALAQHHAPEEMRGRVMSLSLVAFVGIFPFSSFLLGRVATGIGTSATFVGCGAVCLVASVLVVRWRRDIWIPTGIPAEQLLATA
jgi:MFS family permease